YCFDFIFHCNLQRVVVAIRQRQCFVMFPSMPNRSDCVNHEASRQTIAARYLRFAWPTTAERAAFGEQFGPRDAMNRAIDTATAEQCRVRRVHNRINLELCDIAAEDFDFAVGILHESLHYNDDVRMTNGETVWYLRQSPKAFGITETPYNSFRLRHSAFLTARAGQFATIRLLSMCT